MFLQNLTFLLLESVSTFLALCEDEHNPHRKQVKHNIVCKDGRDISVPDGTVIHIELKTIDLKEISDISGYDLEE